MNRPNEAERAKILLEEQYRVEVRRQLEEQKPAESKRWKFLNSSFGIWLLSTLVVSGLGSLWTQYRAVRDDQREQKKQLLAIESHREEVIHQVDLEIGYRLSQVESSLYTISLANEPAPGREAAVWQALQTLWNPPDVQHPGLYPEYGSWSLPALVAELGRNLETDQLDAARRRLIEGDPVLRELHARWKEDPQLHQVLVNLSSRRAFFDLRKIPLDDPTRVAGAILGNLVIDRWKKGNRWSFLDGSESQPFPQAQLAAQRTAPPAQPAPLGR